MLVEICQNENNHVHIEVWQCGHDYFSNAAGRVEKKVSGTPIKATIDRSILVFHLAFQ
jgi:hypothetical protein